MVAVLAATLLASASASATPPPIYRDVSYGPSPAELQTIYAAKAPGARTVILVHGGGWRLQKLATEAGSQAKSLQLQGFAVFDINYDQDSPTLPAFPLETNEVAAATEWAIAHAAAYNADPTNVVMIGGSAGGQLVARTAEQLDLAAPGTVSAVISLSGPMDFTTLVPLAQLGQIKDRSYVTSIGQALGCPGVLSACSPSFEAEWSPALNIPALGCPDWLLLDSEVDTPAILQANEMLADLQAGACNATVATVPTGHGFSYWSQVSARIFAFVRAE
jgi:dipeptidyl aminopeptidase/acylaminoacyl peptidase